MVITQHTLLENTMTIHQEKRARFLALDCLKKCCTKAIQYDKLVDESNQLIDWFRANPDKDEALVREMISDDLVARRQIQSEYEPPSGKYYGKRELIKIDSSFECDCGFSTSSVRAWVYHQCH